MSNTSRVLLTKGNIITQKYGNNGHLGVDIVGTGHTTDTIISHSDGVVVWRQSGYGNNWNTSGNATYGNAIKIQHNNGYCTLYAHLDYISVNQGQKVSKGQSIGYMGNSGKSTASHLHFEVWNDRGIRINPEPYLNADLPNLNTTNNVSSNKYITGTYKVTADPYLNVRNGPGTNYPIKNLNQLTANAREQNKKLGKANINGLAKGCVCTVTEIKNNWGKIPSGWICLDYCVKI